MEEAAVRPLFRSDGVVATDEEIPWRDGLSGPAPVAPPVAW
ncbi:hypothetical protein NX801_20775 [Streptomyces sp. LP05-1]|uniref:Uncharacterized protein n=1 Tax=Streptomyces pyxinae TaxID=2970734 RepID=A0ABT2CKU9_9ACTN|nr:hypothetical protein [Streptomyces sp. LP05-1]MCS0638046.1 hypothetical protein [Streptomyces sp. LP05-1]